MGVIIAFLAGYACNRFHLSVPREDEEKKLMRFLLHSCFFFFSVSHEHVLIIPRKIS